MLSASPQKKRFAKIALIVLCLIALAAGLRRLVVLASPGAERPSQYGTLDVHFSVRPVLTAAHVSAGILLVLLLPLQFSSRVRRRWPKIHRWMGRGLIVIGLFVSITAWSMTFGAIGGWIESAATVTFNTLFLLFLGIGFFHIRNRNILRHREWMIRAFAVLLGVATTRPVMGVFFATSRLTKLSPHDFFGYAFWIGFTLNLVAAELWIRSSRSRVLETLSA